ncbi:HD domain-containing protein [Oryzibacter oryziterrae]|uniref:HD domain-containing protein n=1 Tax=Oryzibacter oryziterrae TaxID=2766474 RepID=UPI001F2EC9E7|nr:HD domain-containing protein [Oryzibacter oryziterrae]
MIEPPFTPHDHLAARLLPHSGGNSGDGSHDMSHLLRVWKNVVTIQAIEGGDAEILAAAVLLHDGVSVEKNSPLRSKASTLAAEKARGILKGLGWADDRIDAVAHAIEAHSYSAGIEPTTIEARILQDADRLDAIGMVGAARCFYIAGRMQSALYDPGDPYAATRPLNDARYAIDHFKAKLFKLADGFKTETGRRLADERQSRLKRFYDEFLEEI